MNNCLIIIILTSIIHAQASPEIKINIDQKSCLKNNISMNTIITVDNEKFNFNPSCNFSFNRTFETITGLKCDIKAGMCSNFSPKNKIKVECGKFSESVPVNCPNNL